MSAAIEMNDWIAPVRASAPFPTGEFAATGRSVPLR
jgi:hypothetical protein